MDGADCNAADTLALRQEVDVLDRACGRLDEEVRRLRAEVQFLRGSRAYRFGKIGSLLVRPVTRAVVAFRRWRLGLLPKNLPVDRHEEDLCVELTEPLPKQMPLGQGQVIFIHGWCSHAGSKIVSVQLLREGRPEPIPLRRMGSSNHRPHGGPPYLSPDDYSFFAQLTFTVADAGTTARMSLQARLSTGAVCTRSLGEMELLAGNGAVGQERPIPAKRVSICMTAFDPPLNLFAKQIDSIRGQTNTEWICLISDDGSPTEKLAAMEKIVAGDPRFRLWRNTERLGFYRNFEACLSRVPAEAEFIALSDHDDIWHPDKLATLMGALDDPAATLAYSDMRIVDAEERVLAPTFWGQRRNNWTNLGSLLLANTVTGAACLFRRSLLDVVMPFPQKIGGSYHDHWIACAALSAGQLRFVDRPLHDYVQHGANVIGHAGCQPIAERVSWKKRFRHWMGWASPAAVRRRVTQWMSHRRAVYYNEVLRLRLIAEVLLVRCVDKITATKKKSLRRVAACDRSAVNQIWLALRRLRGRQDETLGVGRVLATSAFWGQSLHRRTRLRLWTSRLAGRPAPDADEPNMYGIERTIFLHDKTAPLRLQIDPAATRRVNLIVPSLDFRFVFGGYITKLALADALSRAGNRVRLVMLEECELQPDLWKQECRSYPGLETLLDRVELAACYDRRLPLTVHPDDAFLATTWWSAHVAHKASRRLGRGHFVYLIQEYEAFTWPMGTFAAQADESYTFPHSAVFSTELLRDFFRERRLGVYATAGSGEQIAFRNTITAVEPPKAEEMASRRLKRLLVYARPDAHAARNMYELAMLALSRAVQAGVFGPEWEFYGIGAGESGGLARLPQGRVAHLLPRHDQQRYGEVLRGFDVGLALMYTPHPSLVPIEMASAGLVTVTNTYANKTAAALEAISTNLVAVPPTLDGIFDGLRTAIGRVYDYPARVHGSRVDWPTSWPKTFDGAAVAAVQDMLWRRRPAAARAA
jgi:glycosyltransferase involved in cell wall biosynthesis